MESSLSSASRHEAKRRRQRGQPRLDTLERTTGDAPRYPTLYLCLYLYLLMPIPIPIPSIPIPWSTGRESAQPDTSRRSRHWVSLGRPANVLAEAVMCGPRSDGTGRCGSMCAASHFPDL